MKPNLSRDGRPIRCRADENVMPIFELNVGQGFIFRSEDLRSRGITPCRVAAKGPNGVYWKPVHHDADTALALPDTWVVRWEYVDLK